jgi:hypothetical protein
MWGGYSIHENTDLSDPVYRDVADSWFQLRERRARARARASSEGVEDGHA